MQDDGAKVIRINDARRGAGRVSRIEILAKRRFPFAAAFIDLSLMLGTSLNSMPWVLDQ
jgi:hypothetical protein